MIMIYHPPISIIPELASMEEMMMMMMMMEGTPWLLFLFLITITLLHFLHRTINGSRDNLPPGPSPLPVVGSLFELGSHPHRSLAALSKTYGPVMSLQLGQVTAIIVSSPAAAKEALQKNDQPLSARSIPHAVRVLGQEKLSMIWADSSSDRWKHLRSIYRNHLLSPKALDATESLRRKKLRELVEHIRCHAGRPVDIGRVAFATMLNLISSTAFSADMVELGSGSTQEFKDLISAIMKDAGAPNLSDFFPVLRFVDPHGCNRRVAKHLRRLFDVFDGIIEGRLQAVAGGGSDPEPLVAAHVDLLGSLLELHLKGSESGFELGRATIKSILSDVFIAGTDTISTTVEWAMAELLRNPDTMAKACTELTAVIGHDREVEEADISNLPFLQAVVKETFRLHPPGPLLLPHRAESSVELCGYTVPVGSRLLVNVWAIGRDGEVWEEPEAFLPERFLGSEVEFRGQHFELIPFGSGRRTCPGMPLAFRSVHTMLASLLHSFGWRLPEGMRPCDVDVREKFGVTLGKAVPLQAIALPNK